jgi:transcriptional regulator with XRE-family HTH domain
MAMSKLPEPVSLQQMLRLLWEHVPDDDGKPRTVAQVARTTGIREQTLLNLLHGRATDPRLDTLQKLTECFGISLDYFGMTSEATCFGYLARHGKLGAAPGVTRKIEREATGLSAGVERVLLAVTEWREHGAKLS